MDHYSQSLGQKPRSWLPAAIQIKDPVWWRWAAIATLLVADLSGLAGAREVALVIAAYQAFSGFLDDRTPRLFRSQVRITYVCVLALSFVPALELVAWIQMAGTVVLALTGYCPLARTLVLLPGNRRFDLSWRAVWNVAIRPVTSGSILDVTADRLSGSPR